MSAFTRRNFHGGLYIKNIRVGTRKRISNGQFWYGNRTNFPGFLYKKNVGVGTRRSTKMGAGGNITCNSNTYLYNKYKPGQGGVGASSISNRRAKNRLATVCTTNNCFPCYNTLGQYSNYTHNPNGFIPCPIVPLSCASLVAGNVSANMNTSGMTIIIFSNNDDAYVYLPFTGMDFYFFGTNYGNSDGTIPSNSIYMSTNYAFGFGTGNPDYRNWPVSSPAILFDFFDSWNFASYFSPPQNGTISGVKYVRIVATGTDYNSYINGDQTTVKKAYEIYYVRDNCFQYMLFNCSVENVDRTQYNSTSISPGNISNITNGTAFQNTFGSFGNNPPNTGGPQTGGSYVIRSDLNGSNWQFFPNTHLIL